MKKDKIYKSRKLHIFENLRLDSERKSDKEIYNGASYLLCFMGSNSTTKPYASQIKPCE